MNMRWVKLTWAALLTTGLAMAGCSESGGGGTESDGAQSDGQNDGGFDGFFPDVPEDAEDSDSATSDTDTEDTGSDTATTDTGDDGNTPDADGAGGDSVADGEDAPDTPDAPEDVEDTEDDGGTSTNLPPGSPCGPGIGTCAAGASCVETAPGSPDSICYTNAEAGSPCGPGFGQCVAGTKCTKPKGSDQTICVQEVGAGSSCLPIGTTCASGLLCIESTSIAAFDFYDALAPGVDWGDTTGLGRATIDADAGEVLVVHPQGNAVYRYSISEAAGTGKIATLDATAGALAGPQGVAARRDTAINGILIADTGNQRMAFSEALSTYAVFGDAGEGVGEFPDDSPADVAIVDSPGGEQFWATAPSSGAVYRFSTASPYKYQSAFDGGATPFVLPTGLWATESLVYVVDTGAATIRIFDALGVEMGSFGGEAEEDGGLSAPTDVACWNDADLCLVTEPSTGRLVAFDLDGAYRFDVEMPEEAPSWAPAGAAFNAGLLYVSDATNGTVYELEPVADQICVAPLGLGKVCSGTLAPCAAGLICVPSEPGSAISLCKEPADQGEPCGQPNVACSDGLTCVTGDAGSGYAKTCLPAAAGNQPCGPGIGGCAPGFGCNWDGPAHNARMCYPQINQGAACNVYAQGGCLPGLSCELEKIGAPTKVCKPLAEENGLCGQAVASCAPGLVCAIAENILTRRCFAPQPNGAECGIFLPACEPGTSCNFTDATQQTVACYPDNQVGESCALPSDGFCADDGSAECIPLDASGVNYQCLAKTTAEGEACGDFGIAPCVDGTTCIVDQLPAETLTCYKDGADGDLCGVGHGDCDPAAGFGCFVTDDPSLTGDCRPLQPEFAPCEASINDVGACSLLDQVCTCEDPFLGATCFDGITQGQNVCVPIVGLFDICASNAVNEANQPYGKGWAGICAADFICSAAVAGPDPNAPQWLTFICKLAAATGEPCGLFHACEDETDLCLCNGQECTFAQVATGDVGICTPAP